MAERARARWRAGAGRGRRASGAIWPALAALCVGCGEPSETDAPPFELELPVDRSTLANGLELVVVPNHTAPVVTALVAIRAGSAVEDAQTNGYSHLFEHMIFQGSQSVPDAAGFRDRLDGLGVASNGTTSVDRVTYFFDAESSVLEPALELFADAIREPALDPALLEKEKLVVLGEFDLNESHPEYRAYQRARDLVFGADALRLNPLGERATVSRATREALIEMHARHYVPEHALLVFSGDVSPERGRELGERYFGDWSAADTATTAPLAGKAAATSHHELLPASIGQPSIELWWRGPSLLEDPLGVRAGALLSAVCQQTDHQFRVLVQPEVAVSASFSLGAYRQLGYIRIELSVPPGNVRTALSLLSPIASNLGRRGNVSEEQLERARRARLSSYLNTSSSPLSLPHALANTWAGSDVASYFDAADAAYDVGLEDIARFADEYLSRPHVLVLTSGPEAIEAEQLTESDLVLEIER